MLSEMEKQRLDLITMATREDLEAERTVAAVALCIVALSSAVATSAVWALALYVS